jgi:hypothetical protein
VTHSGRRVVGFDLTEVGVGDIDCIVGARILAALCAATLADLPAQDPWPLPV